MGELLTWSTGLSRVFFQIDVVCHRYDFAFCVVAARRANVMWALQLTAVFALIWVCCDKRIMSAAVVAARFGDFILLDSHVATFVKLGGKSPDFIHSDGHLSHCAGPVEGYLKEAANILRFFNSASLLSCF